MFHRMQWLNPPQKVEITGSDRLSMFVTPQTDFWRATHYGFTVDDGPFCYARLGGEFEARVKISGAYRTRFDQMGLMIRRDEHTWIKTGVEYVNEKINVSAVVTHERSDWSLVELDHTPASVWLKARRQRDAVAISYSLDGADYIMLRLAYFPNNTPVMVGMMGASPDGDGFQAIFEEFALEHRPDVRRQAWLRDQAEETS